MASIINASATGVGGVITTADASGVLQLQSNGTTSVEVTNSTFKFNSGYGSVATAYGCRAWVNFNGTGTVAIRASGNVTSITDNGVGLYVVNMTNAMPDINYEVSATAGVAVTTYCIVTAFGGGTGARVAPTTTTFNLSTWNGSTLLDASDICASVFR